MTLVSVPLATSDHSLAANSNESHNSKYLVLVSQMLIVVSGVLLVFNFVVRGFGKNGQGKQFLFHDVSVSVVCVLQFFGYVLRVLKNLQPLLPLPPPQKKEREAV